LVFDDPAVDVRKAVRVLTASRATGDLSPPVIASGDIEYHNKRF
jgi:hypothetical protein